MIDIKLLSQGERMLSAFFFWGWVRDFLVEADRLRRCCGARRYEMHNYRLWCCGWRLKHYSTMIYYQTDSEVESKPDHR